MTHPKNWITGQARIAGAFEKGGRMTTRPRASGESKAKVALAAIRGERTINVGCDAACGEGYGAAPAICCRSFWTAASACALVGSPTSPAWYWLRASAVRPAAL
jgi:hypothetical protein